MTPLGLLGPLSTEWFKNNKIIGCPHPHIPSGKFASWITMWILHIIGTSNRPEFAVGLLYWSDLKALYVYFCSILGVEWFSSSLAKWNWLKFTKNWPKLNWQNLYIISASSYCFKPILFFGLAHKYIPPSLMRKIPKEDPWEWKISE